MTNQFITRKEVADLYGISAKTLMRRLEKRGVKLDKGLIPPADLEKIKQVLGDPDRKAV
ncbi:MAG: hypothetical protein K9J25_07040 [Bacteroidales bacterium]|nr:hypothetical protein [Bacteroidales bacterium]